MFTPGQRVVCIDDCYHPSICEWGDQYPRRGQTYTVREIVVARNHATREASPSLKFAELSNPGDRLSFAPWRFRVIEGDASEAEFIALFEAAWLHSYGLHSK